MESSRELSTIQARSARHPHTVRVRVAVATICSDSTDRRRKLDCQPRCRCATTTTATARSVLFCSIRCRQTGHQRRLCPSSPQAQPNSNPISTLSGGGGGERKHLGKAHTGSPRPRPRPHSLAARSRRRRRRRRQRQRWRRTELENRVFRHTRTDGRRRYPNSNSQRAEHGRVSVRARTNERRGRAIRRP
ncbi:hypothetical protein BDW22DRAFT_699564 [Trametopsis cervina]|nr:hypothetical protein BDW22DRAFT_699564 [Trametopsis cervina]